MTTDYAGLLRLLARSGTEFIIVGGVAAKAHGSARFTNDVDIVYRRTKANIARIVAAFADLHPYLRGAPPGLPFKWDEETIEHGLNFMLTTDLGAIDFLGEIARLVAQCMICADVPAERDLLSIACDSDYRGA